MNIKHNARRAFLGALVVTAELGFCAVVLGADPAPAAVSGPACSLVAKAAATQPAGLPVIVELTLKNIGNEPFEFWRGGPAEYPPATHFAVEVAPVGTTGKIRTVKCENGQYEQGSGLFDGVEPGTSMKFPLSIAPLAAGEYKITVMSVEAKEDDPTTKREKTIFPAARSAAVKISVREDAALTRAARDEWVHQILQGDNFASWNAVKWKTPEVIAKLIPVMSGDDPEAASNAADVLCHFGGMDLPREAGTAAARGIEKGLHADGRTLAHANLLISLAMVARRAGSDEALAAVVTLAHSDLNDDVRSNVVQNLGWFPQPQVTDRLKELVNDKNNRVRSAAAHGLADRGNADAIPVLLKLIKDDPDSRGFNVMALAHFPNDSRAIAAIHAAQNDANQTVRQDADIAWADVLRARTNHGK